MIHVRAWEHLGGVVDGARVGRVQDLLLSVARQNHIDVAFGDLRAEETQVKSSMLVLKLK